MFRNVLLITFRNMRRYKLYSAINIAGLSVGIACCILIGLLIEDDLRYDRFHEHADRIHRLSTWKDMPKASAHLGPRLLEDFPEVERVVRLAHLPTETLTAYQDREFFEEELLYASPSFFDVFSFALVLGDPTTALASPDAIVISQDMAKRYFGDADPIGKPLRISAWSETTKLQVTGVLGDLPRHSHIEFGGLVSYAAYSTGERTFSGAYTYLLLDDKAKTQKLVDKLREWLPLQFTSNEDDDRSAASASTSSRPFRLMPLTDIHLHSHLEQELGANRDINELYLFGSVGILVLLIACANYINLATARSANRAREVGLRKVIGADRRQLMRQFQGEAVFIAVLAFAAGVMLTEMFLPFLNATIGRSLAISYSGRFLCTLSLGVLIVGMLSGSYPAFYLTRFKPTAMMKDLSKATPRSVGFRKGLVVFQFAISIGLIGSTIVVMRQLHFTKNKNLGFESRDVVILNSSEIDYDVYSAEHRFRTIKDELRRNPNILNVSLSFVVPGEEFWTGSEFTLIDAPESKPTIIKTMYIDQDYLETLGINLVAGQNFKSAFATKSYDGVIFNESAAREMGIGRTTGQKVHMNLGNVVETNGTIVGIVRDFHIRSLHHKIEPLALRLHLDNVGVRGHARHLVARLRPENVPATLQFLRDKLAEFAPSQHFRYTFLDTYFDFDHLYQNETRLMRVFGTFSGLAVFLAFLGLFGLAYFTTENRTREIGIRKVLGASDSDVVALVSRDFVVLVIIAIVIAWPVVYFGAEALLQNFAYRVGVGWWTFPLSGAMALGLALFTVGWHARRAARANPADVLRQE